MSDVQKRSAREGIIAITKFTSPDGSTILNPAHLPPNFRMYGTNAKFTSHGWLVDGEIRDNQAGCFNTVNEPILGSVVQGSTWHMNFENVHINPSGGHVHLAFAEARQDPAESDDVEITVFPAHTLPVDDPEMRLPRIELPQEGYSHSRLLPLFVVVHSKTWVTGKLKMGSHAPIRGKPIVGPLLNRWSLGFYGLYAFPAGEASLLVRDAELKFHEIKIVLK